MVEQSKASRTQKYLALWAPYMKPMSLRMFFLGFSSGLPPLLILGTLSFWLRESGIELQTIGFFSWVGLIYAGKWIWAPAVDNCTIPFWGSRLGRRRSWLLLSQIGLAGSLFLMSVLDPSSQLWLVLGVAMTVAFFSATQDIALDAYRIEAGSTNLQGIFAAMYQAGYRLAMIWAGAGALTLASFGESYLKGQTGWHFAYVCMSFSMAVGVLVTLFSPEPDRQTEVVSAKVPFIIRFRNGFLNPIRDFFKRFQKIAIPILLLVALYRISDVVMGVMANPFYYDLGFTKNEVAFISKVFGVLMTLIGAFIGGAITLRVGVYKALLLGAILSSVTNILFSILSTLGHNVSFLMFTISADNLAAGIASSAFVAFLSSLTSKSFSATQYALLSSLMVLLPKTIAGFSGLAVAHYGYQMFFWGTAILGLPVIALVMGLYAMNRPHPE